MKKYTQKAQIAFIKQMITTDARWAQRALRVVFQNQTDDEKVDKETKHENGVGFTSNDANLLTSFAKGLEKYGSLTEKQLPYLYKKIGKYAGQVYRYSDKEKLIAIMEKHNA